MDLTELIKTLRKDNLTLSVRDGMKGTYLMEIKGRCNGHDLTSQYHIKDDLSVIEEANEVQFGLIQMIQSVRCMISDIRSLGKSEG